MNTLRDNKYKIDISFLEKLFNKKIRNHLNLINQYQIYLQKKQKTVI